MCGEVRAKPVMANNRGNRQDSSFSFLSSLYKTDVTIESSRLKSSAHQNPSTLNPFMKLSASNIIRALMTKRNNPNVIMVMGRVSNMSTGFKIAFKIASTTATTIAVQKVSIVTPPKIYDKPNATMEVTTMRMMNFIT